MVEDPPLLKIRRNFDRPTAAQIAGFSDAPTGNVVDAMDGSGALDQIIKPMDPPSSPIVGVAVTCHTGPSDNLGLFAALDIAKPGDVLMAATESHIGAAVAGDLMAGMAKNIGVVALVTDGAMRDIDGIAKVGLPVFCAAITPNSPVRNGPGTAGLPVVMGGVHVTSGDIIVADADGVVVVPFASIDKVLAQLSEVRAAEAALEAKVNAGLKVPDFIREILDSDRVIELE